MSNNPRADHQWQEKILRRERFADFAHTLARIDWQILPPIPLKIPMPRLSVQYDMYIPLVVSGEQSHQTPYGRLLMGCVVSTGERGEDTIFPQSAGGVVTCNIMTLRSPMMRLWKMTSGNADGDFRLYDRSLAGADYICKALTGANEV